MKLSLPVMKLGSSPCALFLQAVQFSVSLGVVTVLDPFKSLKFVHPTFAPGLSARWSMSEPQWVLCLCEAAVI